MPDLLTLDLINSLPQPFMIRQWGEKDFMWELIDIDVESGLLRFWVCGKTQVGHIGNIAEFRDMNGVVHDSESFYVDA
jgi:hypothetical protein